MPMQVREWIDVDGAHLDFWNSAIATVFTSRPPGPVLCPICRIGEFRYFYLRNPAAVYRGGSWYWCHGWWRFQHASGRVPKWWRDVSGVPPEMLIPMPTYLDEHWQDISAIQLGLAVEE